MKAKDSHTHCFHHDHHGYCSVALPNLIFVCRLLPLSENGNEIDCEIDCSRFVPFYLKEPLCFLTLTPAHWSIFLKSRQQSEYAFVCDEVSFK